MTTGKTLPASYWQILILLLSPWSEVKSLSCVQLVATPWTAAYQAPPSVGFSRQEYWSGLPFPSLYCLIVLPFPKCYIVEIIWYVAFSDWLLSLSHIHLNFFISFHGLIFHFFLSLNNIPVNIIYYSLFWRRKWQLTSCVENPWTEEPGRLQSMGLQELDTT